MLREEKKSFVSEFEDIYRQSASVIVAHYHGVTANQAVQLRKSLKPLGGSLRIVKNTLSKLAAKQAGVDNMSDLLSGPSAVIYSDDVLAVSKVLVAFAKDVNPSLKIIGALVDKNVLDAQSVISLAELPSLDELRGKIVGLLQAPASKLARVLKAYAEQV